MRTIILLFISLSFSASAFSQNPAAYYPFNGNANDHYFAVPISGGTTPQYTALYDYSGNIFVSPATEPALQLFKRTDNSAATWSNSGASLDMGANTLTVSGQNTEYLLGSSGIALPVTLLSLEARKINTSTLELNWQTATETNNRGFEVQRSFDGVYFTDLKFVTGTGNSTGLVNYSTTDIPGRNGRVYYRLKQVDMDGNSKLSNIVSLLFDKQGIIKVYPNPAQQQVIVEGINNYGRVLVLDGTGRLVKDMINNMQYQLKIDLAGLKNGFYFIRLMNEKETQTIRLTISN